MVAQRPPPYDYGAGSEEELEELDDDAIVAQQSAAHAPAPRVQVAMEKHSIVVADLPPEVDESEVMATRQLPAYQASRILDPTVVVRRAPAAPASGGRGWVAWVIWGVAGLLAFAFGGLLALLSARTAPKPAPAQVVTVEPP
jgi:hypothetical protein